MWKFMDRDPMVALHSTCSALLTHVKTQVGNDTMHEYKLVTSHDVIKKLEDDSYVDVARFLLSDILR